MSNYSLDSIAETLTATVHAKIVEEGWTQEDDTSLAEYIVLMLANGKAQDQIASELASELLQDAKGTPEFAQWLFDQVAMLTSSGSTEQYSSNQNAPGANNNESSLVAEQSMTEDSSISIPAAYDADIGESAPDNAPRGPKGMHGGRPAGRGGRGGIQNNKQSGDSALHRTRGNDRIGSHMRGAPKGPRNVQSQNVRPGVQKALNGMGLGNAPPNMPNPMMQNGSPQGQGMMPMSPQQQLEFMAMMEQQARMMAQFMPGMAQQGMNPNYPNNPAQQNAQGRSLFDRVESGRGRGSGASRGRGRGGPHQNGQTRNTASTEGGADAENQSVDGASSMDVESTGPAQQAKFGDPTATMCRFNNRCSNKECIYVHQTPAATGQVTVDMNETCKFGAECKNARCVGKHPSPAQLRAKQAEEICRFFPNCQNPICPFKHPNMPLCKNGADCKDPDCKFTHLTTKCRFNPCLNVQCPYKHEQPGQKRGLADYQWTPESAKQKELEQANQQENQHVSDRKFVDDTAGEELIKPESENEAMAQRGQEVVT